ncbi:MAG: putative transposase [Chthonomonadales bacterium]|nr:putative transposase [Chthonomonadales bacterium]
MKTRTTYSAELKAKLALGVIKGNRTLTEFANYAQVHPILLTQLKRLLLDSLPTVFLDKSAREHKEQEALTDQLYLQTCLDFTWRMLASGTAFSIDGPERVLDNIFVEHFWRTVKYEDI